MVSFSGVERSIAVRQKPDGHGGRRHHHRLVRPRPKTRYRVAAAVVRLFERPNDKAPYEWASLTRQLLLKAPDPEAVFNEIVDRLHPTSWSGSLATELEARLTLLDQLDINAVPELAAALDATKATLKDRTELERRRETVEDRARNGRFKKRSIRSALT